MPGWPLPTFWTASIASTRTVSTALSSSSVQSSFAGVVLTGLFLLVGASAVARERIRAPEPVPAVRGRFSLLTSRRSTTPP